MDAAGKRYGQVRRAPASWGHFTRARDASFGRISPRELLLRRRELGMDLAIAASLPAGLPRGVPRRSVHGRETGPGHLAVGAGSMALSG